MTGGSAPPIAARHAGALAFCCIFYQFRTIFVKIPTCFTFLFLVPELSARLFSTVGGFVGNISASITSGNFSELHGSADAAAELLKTLSHSGRLMILCNLADGEKSVGELEEALATRQAAVSQQLARLRKDDLVSFRRDGKAVYYALSDDRARQVIELLYALYCR